MLPDPPAWLLWLCVSWAALTFVLSVLTFGVVAWGTSRARRARGFELSDRDSSEGQELLNSLDEEREHIERSHG